MRKTLLTGGCLLLLAAFVQSPVSVLAEDAATPISVGTAAPDITLTGIDGKEFKLSDVAAKGKNVALMFSRANW